jgi:hypothetical protein
MEEKKMTNELEINYIKSVIEMYQEAIKEPNKSERLLRIAFCLTLLEDKELLKELREK